LAHPLFFVSKIEKGISTITESGKHFIFFLNKKVIKIEVRDIKVGREVLWEAKRRFRHQKPEGP
jgi:hypothetical protein